MKKSKKTKTYEGLLLTDQRAARAYDRGYAAGYMKGLRQKTEKKEPLQTTDPGLIHFDLTPSERSFGSSKPIIEVLYELDQLFCKKNHEYSRKGNIFANFDESMPVIKGQFDSIEYCMTLAAKQDDAFWTGVSNGIPYPSLRERLLDGAVYRIIALALMDRKP